MKGTPHEPKCGFSAGMVKILALSKIKFAACDISSDPDLKQSIKAFSDFETFPQLYCRGELIGGFDIILSYFKNDELITALLLQFTY